MKSLRPASLLCSSAIAVVVSTVSGWASAQMETAFARPNYAFGSAAASEAYSSFTSSASVNCQGTDAFACTLQFNPGSAMTQPGMLINQQVTPITVGRHCLPGGSSLQGSAFSTMSACFNASNTVAGSARYVVTTSIGGRLGHGRVAFGTVNQDGSIASSYNSRGFATQVVRLNVGWYMLTLPDMQDLEYQPRSIYPSFVNSVSAHNCFARTSYHAQFSGVTLEVRCTNMSGQLIDSPFSYYYGSVVRTPTWVLAEAAPSSNFISSSAKHLNGLGRFPGNASVTRTGTGSSIFRVHSFIPTARGVRNVQTTAVDFSGGGGVCSPSVPFLEGNALRIDVNCRRGNTAVDLDYNIAVRSNDWFGVV